MRLPPLMQPSTETAEQKRRNRGGRDGRKTGMNIYKTLKRLAKKSLCCSEYILFASNFFFFFF